MYKLFMLAFANIRKTIGHTISLFTMFFIAALLLNAGLLVLINFGGFFDKTVNELNTSNVYYILSSHLYNDEVENNIKNNENVLEMQKEDVMWVKGNAKTNGETQENFYVINNADNDRNISKWKFIGEHLSPEEMSVYLPGVYKSDYNLDDKFELTINNVKYTFTVKGFIEDIYFSSIDTGLIGIYLPRETYESLSNELSDTNNATLIYANLKKVNKDLEKDLKKLTNADTLSAEAEVDNTFFSLDLSILKLTRTMMANMMSLMIVVFAAIITGICLIVIRFRIVNSIEDDMTKIGALKAMGYTSKQIKSSIVMQFTLIALVGSIAGILISYLLTPTLSDVFAIQSGIIWVQGFDGIISSFSLAIIILIVILTGLLSARRINKLEPIIALRGGLITHSFRKNHLPLNKTRGSLPVVLAIKHILQNFKQSFMIIVILITISFAGSFAVVMFYNTTIDTKTFLETPGIELSNIAVVLNPEIDNTPLVENIKKMSDVRKLQFIDELIVNVDDNEVSAFVMKDYASKETDTIYEGRYPIHNNEIAISGYLSNIISKNIGDTITIKLGENESQLLVTGLTQGAYMLGLNVSIIDETALKLKPDFKQQVLRIYLHEDVNTAEVVTYLDNTYGDSVKSIIDLEKDMEQGASTYIDIVSLLGTSILVVTIAVVILVLYFVINSSVIRRKRELGIQKAIGFTTLQLMNQLSIGFIFPIIIGVVIGSLIGITQTNSIMSIVQRSMGIMKASYIITPLWIGLFGVVIVIISYITSMVLTYRIRKISAYALVSE